MNPLFAVHKLNEAGSAKAQAIADLFNVLLSDLSEMCPDGRELAIVKTKLEEAAFFAKKAMAKDPANQL
jgi:RAB protein geranylgeranyltransferase component A